MLVATLVAACAPPPVAVGPRAGSPASRWPTVDIADGATMLRYDTAGRLVGIEPRVNTPLEFGVADGGGNHAVLRGDRIVVTGERMCSLQVKLPDAIPVDEGDTGAGRDAPQEPVVPVAVSADFAVLAGPTAAQVIDLATCSLVDTPLLSLGAGDLTIKGSEVVSVNEAGGFRVHRWSLPNLTDLGGFSTFPVTLLDGAVGPSLLLEGSLVAGDAGVTFAGELKVNGQDVLDLETDGRLLLLDADGRVLEATAPGALTHIGAVDHGTDELWVSDGGRVVHLPGGEFTRAPLSSRHPTPDEPESIDRLSASPTGTLEDPVFPATLGDRYAVRPRPGGVIVTRAGHQFGGTIPVWPDDARVTPDGTVVVTCVRTELSAWQVADGTLLWTRTIHDGSKIHVGSSWVATRDGRAWTLYNPHDGSPIGGIDLAGAMIVNGERLPFDPTKLRGASWASPRPSQSRYLREVSPRTRFAATGVVCADPTAALRPLRGWPEVHNAERARLAEECPAMGVGPDPAWPTTSTPVAGASWAWTMTGGVYGIDALADGFLLVSAGTRIGVLGPDGALRWSALRAGNAYAAGRVVLRAVGGVLSAREAATGRVLWTRAGLLRQLRPSLRLEYQPTYRAPVGGIDPMTGEPVPAVEVAAHGSFERDVVRDGERVWTLRGDTITAIGLPPPATTATPAVQPNPPARPAPLLPPEIPLPRDRPLLALVSPSDPVVREREPLEFGDIRVRADARGFVVAEREGTLLWKLPGGRGEHLRAVGATLIVDVGDRTLTLDPGSGRVVRVAMSVRKGG